MHPCLSTKNEDSNKTEILFMERAPRQMFAAIFKKNNVVGGKASRSAYDLLYPSILKLYPLIIHIMGDCGEET